MELNKKVAGALVAGSLVFGVVHQDVYAESTTKQINTESEGNFLVGGVSPLENVSKDETKYRALFDAGKSYIIKNLNKDKYEYVDIIPPLFKYVNVAIYNADGSIESLYAPITYDHITIPAGGSLHVTALDGKDTTSIKIDKTVFDNYITIEETELTAISFSKVQADHYYTIENTVNKPQQVRVQKNSVYDSPKSIVVYNNNNVIVDEYTKPYNTDKFIIPAGGHAIFIQGNQNMNLFYPSKYQNDLTITDNGVVKEELRKWDFDFEEVKSPYLTYKVIRVTNNGGDNLFKLTTSSNIQVLGEKTKNLYLASGKSMEVVVKPKDDIFTTMTETLNVEENNYSTNHKVTKFPLTFKTPEVGRNKVTVKDTTVKDLNSKENSSYLVSIGDKKGDFSFSLNQVDNIEAQKKGYKNTYVNTNFNNDTKRYEGIKYFEGANLAYQGFLLNAREIANSSYKLSTGITLTGTNGGDEVIKDYIVSQVFDIALKEVKNLAPFYNTLNDCLEDQAMFDRMAYKLNNGEITDSQVRNYVDSLYASMMTENLSSSIDTIQKDAYKDMILKTIEIVGGPSAYGLGALWSAAFAIQDWAMETVWDVWDTNVIYWIGHDANKVVEGRYDKSTYIDKNDVSHLITVDSNKIIN